MDDGRSDDDESDDAGYCACVLECECMRVRDADPVLLMARGGLSSWGIDVLGLTLADLEEP